MIRTESFSHEAEDWLYEAKEEVMDRLNSFIEENNIQRQDILEFRTEENYIRKMFKVVISWWE
jgi:hypothetical protein